MRSRITFILQYFSFWVCSFVVARLVFLLYQHVQSFSLTAGIWLDIFRHGLKLDFSMAGYLTLLPCLVMLCASFFNYKPAYYVLNVYTSVFIILFLLITFVDMEAYKYWGVRLDSTPLRFLGKPKETLASSSFITLVLYLIAFISLTWLLYKAYRRYVAQTLINSNKTGFAGVIVFSLLTAIMIIPVRGSFGVSPVNTGSVYFSKIAFANHSAINVVWNFGHSLLEGKETRNPFAFYKTSTFENELKQYYQDKDEPLPVLNNKRPDIMLIILESFSAKLIEPLGGAKGITPEFNELCKNGILFSEIYSTDSRTDKGLATIISGYPVLEAIPILKYAEKTQNLPFISRSLMNYNYQTSFMYGGDVDFANMRSYLHNGGFGKITSDEDFRPSLRTGKWGVPDHYVFKSFLADVKADTGRWFKVLLTLTNHEPFEIPTKPKFGDKNLTEKFYSSAYYTDSCLGSFIRNIKESGLWENTLIILIADHGSRLPDFDDVFEPRKHHIPMLWTGGAVSRDTVISKIGSQADLAVTLLHQLGISTNGFILGKDMLSLSSKSFTFYSIKNGISMLTDSSGFGYDFTTGDFSFSYGTVDSSHVHVAKSFQQYVFENYLKLSER